MRYEPKASLRFSLKRRIPTLKRLIEDCDRLVAELDQEIRSEENRVKIHDPKAVAYSACAKATTSRRDNLRRSANELSAHLGKAEKTLRGLGLYFRLYAPS
jgi:flagellar protein FliJ